MHKKIVLLEQFSGKNEKDEPVEEKKFKNERCYNATIKTPLGPMSIQTLCGYDRHTKQKCATRRQKSLLSYMPVQRKLNIQF